MSRKGAIPPVVLFLLLLALGLVGFYLLAVKPTRDLAKRIDTYLGNNRGDDPTKWNGLTGNITANNAQLREAMNKMACRMWKLEHPTEPLPSPCPPGPPTDSPTKPPGYPP